MDPCGGGEIEAISRQAVRVAWIRVWLVRAKGVETGYEGDSGRDNFGGERGQRRGHRGES